MKRPTRWLLVASILFSPACAPASDATQKAAEVSPKKTSKKVKKGPRLEGEVHAARQRKRILPFIMHQPSMDLRVQCLSYRDMLAEHNKPAVPLCFEERERKVETEVTVLRIEHKEGLSIPHAVAALSAKHEATHFIIDAGGTPYQLLDLALPVRRGEGYPSDEIRIVSGNQAGLEKVTKALKGLYPQLKESRLDFSLEIPSKRAVPRAMPRPMALPTPNHAAHEGH